MTVLNIDSYNIVHVYGFVVISDRQLSLGYKKVILLFYVYMSPVPYKL
jgi:hypothetical protein